MKTAAEVASHSKVRLHQEVIEILRASGSEMGAGLMWNRMRLNKPLWKRVAIYGLDVPERQLQLSKIAFPVCNRAEVDTALRAGNNLSRLYELACGRASIAKDSAGHHKIGAKGLKIVKHASSPTK